jgi:hypothetical protein
VAQPPAQRVDLREIQRAAERGEHSQPGEARSSIAS